MLWVCRLSAARGDGRGRHQTEHRGETGSLGTIVNLLRSVPFIILLVFVLPLTRLIVGTTIGSTATIVPLVIAAAPFVARMVESSVKEVDRGVHGSVPIYGRVHQQVVLKVTAARGKPSLIVGAAIATTTVLSYSAMSGIRRRRRPGHDPPSITATTGRNGCHARHGRDTDPRRTGVSGDREQNLQAKRQTHPTAVIYYINSND
jgi:hypothetical protein